MRSLRCGWSSSAKRSTAWNSSTPTSGEVLAEEGQFFLFPAVHHVMPENQMQVVLAAIRAELDAAGDWSFAPAASCLQGPVTTHRTDQVRPGNARRDGYVPGNRELFPVHGWSKPGERPYCLMDYFDYAPPRQGGDAREIVRGGGAAEAAAAGGASPISEKRRDHCGETIAIGCC